MSIAWQSTEVSSGNAAYRNTPNFTPSGSNVILIVGISYKSSTEEITSARWGGTDYLDELRNDVNGNARTAIYYLINPAQVSRFVRVDFDSSLRACISASIYTGVHQSTPFSSNVGNNGTDNAPTVTVTAGANTMVVDSLCQVSNGPDTATKQNETERANLAATGGGSDTRHASQEDSTSPSTMAWSMGGSDNWALSAGTLQEPVVGVSIPIIMHHRKMIGVS
jgi:hypothetical protein